jgi:hypothetical protein
LPNGLRFLVVRRPYAPVVSAHVRADVGAFDEASGLTGRALRGAPPVPFACLRTRVQPCLRELKYCLPAFLVRKVEELMQKQLAVVHRMKGSLARALPGIAHLLEHMAFKGTPEVGSVDWAREAPLLDALDEAFYELREADPDSPQVNVQERRVGGSVTQHARATSSGYPPPTQFPLSPPTRPPTHHTHPYTHTCVHAPYPSLLSSPLFLRPPVSAGSLSPSSLRPAPSPCPTPLAACCSGRGRWG